MEDRYYMACKGNVVLLLSVSYECFLRLNQLCILDLNVEKVNRKCVDTRQKGTSHS